MDSTSEDEDTNGGAPFLEDSYHGKPIRCMEASRDGIVAMLGNVVSLSDGPKDFATFVSQRNGKVFAEDEARARNALQRTKDCSDEVSTQDGDEGDGDNEFTNPGDSWKVVTPRTQSRKGGSKGKGKGHGKSKSTSKVDEAKPFQHQVCFEWSRKADGCSALCPNGRKHLCEHCGSPNHRGIEHKDAVEMTCEECQEVGQGDVQLSILKSEVVVNPTDFGFLLRGASPVWRPTAHSDKNDPQLTVMPPQAIQEQAEEDNIENEDSNSKRARMCNSQVQKAGQPSPRMQTNQDHLNIAEKEKRDFSHQRCFEWSRKADGCSFPCPRSRLHVCEFCGSPDHRGLQCDTQSASSHGHNINGKRIRSFTKNIKVSGSWKSVSTRRQAYTM
jgi:hypothetical protein